MSSPHRFVVPEKQDNGHIHTKIILNNERCYTLFWRCLVGNVKYRADKEMSADRTRGNSVSKIDITSRYLFPGSFVVFHIVYWAWYLNNTVSNNVPHLYIAAADAL